MTRRMSHERRRDSTRKMRRKRKSRMSRRRRKARGEKGKRRRRGRMRTGRTSRRRAGLKPVGERGSVLCLYERAL